LLDAAQNVAEKAMICPNPNCHYVFVEVKPPPGVCWRSYCPRCHCLYLGREPDWHDMRPWKYKHRLTLYTEERL
jgi:hypothetical protein